jgi:Lipocalin-like domain
MSRCVAVLAVLFACSGSVLAQSEAEIRDRIVGTWKLVSTEQTMKDGTTRPYPRYGPRGKGFLMYTREGYMCADLVNPDRPKWAEPYHLTAEEKAATADGTFAYCGKYEIDVKQNQIVHLPEVATDPGYVGSRQVRPYKFEDGRLVLSGVETQEPGVTCRKIVWEKAR